MSCGNGLFSADVCCGSIFWTDVLLIREKTAHVLWQIQRSADVLFRRHMSCGHLSPNTSDRCLVDEQTHVRWVLVS